MLRKTAPFKVLEYKLSVNLISKNTQIYRQKHISQKQYRRNIHRFLKTYVVGVQVENYRT